MMRLFYLLLAIGACHSVPSRIVRPCKNLEESCIRENLAINSGCNRNVLGYVPNEYTITSFPFENAFFNSSYIDNNLIIRNHNNCKVSEFFYNLDSDNAVLAIRCLLLDFESTRTLIQHYPEAEDVAYSYYYRGSYPEVIITVNLHNANAMDLCSSYAFTYVVALPNFYINPNDVKTQNFLSTDLTFLNIFERETFFWRGQELLRYFVNSRLCNFGCNF